MMFYPSRDDSINQVSDALKEDAVVFLDLKELLGDLRRDSVFSVAVSKEDIFEPSEPVLEETVSGAGACRVDNVVKTIPSKD
jgi:hypothetical protein